MGQDQNNKPLLDGAASQPAAAADPSTPQQRSQRRRDWTQIGTMVAAFAAAGGLIASAWTGYYSVQTAEDQLAQSSEDSDRELKQQAALVSTWVQENENGPTGYLANRSLDPITQVTIGLASGSDGEVEEGRFGKRKELLFLGDVPPCSRVAIPPIAARHALNYAFKDINYAIAGLSFVDVRGQRWGRATNKPLQAMELPPTGRADPEQTTLGSTWILLFGKLQVGAGIRFSLPGAKHSDLEESEPLTDCGTDTK